MREILLYGPIYNESAQLFIQGLQEAGEEEVTVRVNSEGGSPEYAWGMVAKFQEYKGKKNVKVDGMAHSMGMYFLCYADDVEALDVAEFCFHRCAYPSWIESNPDWFSEPMKENLARVNASLQKALAAKIDIEAFENLKQVKEKNIRFKDVFSMDSRIDVYLSAADAKKIGLVNSVLKITPLKSAEINSLLEKSAIVFQKAARTFKTTEEDKSKKTITMTIENLKAEHPAIFQAAVSIGIKQELDRVKSCLVFQDIDPAGVKTAIESGEPLSETQKSEFALKTFNKAAIAKVEGGNAEDVKTDAEKEAKAIEEKNAKTEAFLKEAGLRK